MRRDSAPEDEAHRQAIAAAMDDETDAIPWLAELSTQRHDRETDDLDALESHAEQVLPGMVAPERH